MVGFGLLSFIGHDAEEMAEHLVSRLHLNPARHYPMVFIQAMAEITDARLWLFAGLAALYAAVRFIEAYGLWQARRWAEWFAALSGAIYVPFEVFELWHHATWLKFAALVINLVIVGYMVWLLTERLRVAEKKLSGAVG